MILLSFLLLPSTALAFQASPDLVVGAGSQRVRRVHATRQQHLRQGAGWQAFVQGEGAGWRARFDEQTGTARRAWGPGIPMGVDGDSTRAEVGQALTDFLGRNQALLGVPVSRLALARAVYVESSEHWIVRFDQVLPTGSEPALLADRAERWHALDELSGHDAPVVWQAGVTAHIRYGRLVMVGIDTVPQADGVDTRATLSAQTAIELAISDGPAPDALHQVEGAVLTALPLETDEGLGARLAWAVRTRTSPEDGDEPGLWMSFVDARTGDLLDVSNQVRFASGAVYGSHDTRTVDGNMSVSPLPYVTVANAEESAYAADDGSFALTGDAFEVDGIKGEFFRVRNRAGGDGFAAWTDGDLTLTDADATQAEIDSYVFLSQVREWLLDYGPDLDYATDRLTSNVNMSSACNAYYDGDVNFFQAGSGCSNTGRIADVNYHEWGHGLHAAAAGTWYVDGSIGEGAGDVTAFLQTGDSTIAPYFSTSGAGIRDVARDRVYPDDWTGEVHSDGLIFAGAVWDLMELLAEESSPEEAHDLVSELFVEALRDNFATDTAYDAFMVADDDNGDLSDGTPHMCEIIETFSRHGLTPSGASSMLQLSHAPLGNQAATGVGYAVQADIVNLAPECLDPVWADAQVVYSTDGGETWQSAPLDVSATDMSGSIPEQPAGTVVEYYLSADGGEAGQATAPTGGEVTPYSFYVGELQLLGCDDFESDDGGYVSAKISGGDDWDWGRPQGGGGDPDQAFSGDKVWGNDLGRNGEYSDSASNRLSSAPIDVAGYEQVVVQFERWLTVEDGYYDQARVVANDRVVWENHATNRSIGDENHQDDQWMLQTIAIDLDGADQLELAWELESDQGLSFGGWNIDDVCVYTVGEPAADADTGGQPTPASCGCAATGGAGGAALWIGGLLGMLGLARRRR